MSRILYVTHLTGSASTRDLRSILNPPICVEVEADTTEFYPIIKLRADFMARFAAFEYYSR
jgi:hypothetical protein